MNFLIAETTPNFEPPGHWPVIHAWPGIVVLPAGVIGQTMLEADPAVLSISEASNGDVLQLVALHEAQ